MAIATVLAGCSSTPGRAPVEERAPIGASSRPSVSPAPLPKPSGAPTAATATTVTPSPVPPPASNTPPVVPTSPSAAPGTYVVKPGDTLIRIGLDTGQNWRDIARWSGVENPNLIEVGQVLRVAPPTQDGAAATARPVPGPGRVESRPLDNRPAGAEPAAGPAATTGAAAGADRTTITGSATGPAAGAPSPVAPPAAQAGTGPAAAAAQAPARTADEAVEWAWPASGTVIASFDEVRGVKGLSLSGKAGDPVLAAADGRVVYAGSGLRGYGNLVIVKHNSTFLTAYAHNQTLLVKEDQAVRRGQKIAEMGSSDADQVKLHFEIRRQGKPVDPARLLPAR